MSGDHPPQGGRGGRGWYRRAQHSPPPRQPALLAQPLQPAPASAQGRQAGDRLQRRDHPRLLPDLPGRDRPRGGPRPHEGGPVSHQLVTEITYFVLAVFIGFEVISKVPTILHTPLMSGSNAIHGIILVGALIIAAGAQSPLQVVLGFVAVLLATTNVVGGFVVTDRMLEMFKGRQGRREGSS